MNQFASVGIDGTLLRLIVGRPFPPRTSADLVLPILLARTPWLRVGLVGGTPEANARARVAIAGMVSDGSEVCYSIDGYSGLTASEVPAGLDILIVGLGAPLQDQFASELIRLPNSPRLVVTCGGWLDQVSVPTYYPPWAYRLKLNWLVRLIREPRRLWRRYSIDAAIALRLAPRLRREVVRLPGFEAIMGLDRVVTRQ
ncbi:WecB/TagA/CpsF family glycosyltransferase [Agromyces indicus]